MPTFCLVFTPNGSDFHCSELLESVENQPATDALGLDGLSRTLLELIMNMRLTIQGDTLVIHGLHELNSANADDFRDQIRSIFSDGLRNIDIDLSQATFMDSCGLGALISLHRSAFSRSGLVRLRDPGTQVRQMLELTRMRRIFEIIDTHGCGSTDDFGGSAWIMLPSACRPVPEVSSSPSVAVG
jgi:anti-sigma B factor antagonist